MIGPNVGDDRWAFPDEALDRTTGKFISRYQFLERECAKDGKVMGEMTLAEMDAFWERAKE